MYDLDAVMEGLMGVLEPRALMLMVGGVIVSSFFAALPGIGSLMFLSMIIPYAMTLPPYHCIALLLGIATVSNTANTFSSVLIAVPGSAGSQATVVDGYPMARKGEANRAFGAAFSASALGALFGGAVFLATLPVMRPLVLHFGSPDFLMLVIWGLSAVAILGGNAPLKGLMAAVFGLAVSLIGTDARTGIERFAFEGYYLWDGVSVILVALGVFAVPELVDLAVRRTSVSDTGTLGGGLMQGVRDTFENWWLVIRCSIIGVWIGALPGLGSSVADWFAYAHTVQSEKNPENFGKGDVRGVIGPESSNNAKEGGALIPTTLFGIPGSVSFALILVAFIAVGIEPGRDMLTTQLPYLYAMISVLVLANLLATGIAMGFSSTFAKASIMPFYIIVPMTLVLCMIAAFSVSYSLEDVITFLVFSTIGFFMKRYGWPRPPVLVAVVLGPQLERYLWLTVDRYGAEWMLHWDVIGLFGLIIVTVIVPMILRSRKGDKRVVVTTEINVGETAPPKPDAVSRPRPGSLVMVVLFMAMLITGVVVAMEWPTRAAFTVFVIATVGIFLALSQLGWDVAALIAARRGTSSPVEESGTMRRQIEAGAWIAALLASIVLLGFHASFFLFPVIYVRVHGGGWRLALFLGALADAGLVGIFDFMVRVVWPQPVLLGFLYP